MLAFFRVFAFYAATAALLIWGLFALGWADAFELPGFESETRSRPGPQTVAMSKPWEEPAALPVPKNAAQRTEYVPPSEQSRVMEIQQPASPPASAAPWPPVMRPADPPAQVVLAPQPPPAPRFDPPPAPRVEPPRVEMPKQVQPEPSRAPEPQKQVRTDPPPARVEIVKPEPPRPTVQVEQPRVLPSTQPVAPPAAPQPPPGRAADAAPITRPPVKDAPSPVTSKPAVSTLPDSPSTARWAPMRRVAGFGIDALADNLDEVRRGSGDVPCIVLQNVVFKPGTSALTPRTRTELELIAKVLNAQSEHRIEIGSRLGPGTPMSTDAKLRADRVRVVRESLITMGVPSERLLVEATGTYERVTDDVAKLGPGRRQSIGMCVHA